MKLPEFFKVNRHPEPSRCHHTSEDGTNCKAPAQSGKYYCFFHDPAQKEKRAEANRNGGAMRGRRGEAPPLPPPLAPPLPDRKRTPLNSTHTSKSYSLF